MRRLLCFAVAAATMLLGSPDPAQSQTSFELASGPACTDGTVLADGVAYTSCWGAFEGNDEPPSAVEAYLASVGIAATYFGKTEAEGATGPFDPFADELSSGTLELKDPLVGPFVLSLKAASKFSLYYFAGTGPWTEIDFDTEGVSLNPVGIAQGLSHASIYRLAVTTPEPGTMTLLAMGLMGLGFVAWRRRDEVPA